MPILRKIIKVGKSSRAIVLPSEWLDYHEKEGREIDYVLMEINDELTIKLPRSPEGSEQRTG